MSFDFIRIEEAILAPKFLSKKILFSYPRSYFQRLMRKPGNYKRKMVFRY